MSHEEIQVIGTEERSYFSMMPHIADDELDVYEYRLYGHYRRVCGEANRPCVEKVRGTAQKLGIALGTVVQARARLAEKGFIRLHRLRCGSVERVDVTLAEIWPRNMLRYAVSPHERAVSPDERPKNNPNKKNLPKKNLKKPPPQGSPLIDAEDGPVDNVAALREEEGYVPGVRLALAPLAKAMLEECGLVSEIAERFAQTIAFETLREYVMAWRADPGAGVGALKYRIEGHWRHGPLLPDDYVDPFYLKYRTPEELALAQVEQSSGPPLAAMAEPSATQTAAPVVVAPAADSSAEAATWAQVLSDLALQMSTNSYNTWVRDTWLVQVDGDTWCIGVPNAYALDWLQSRLRNKCQRTLARLTGRTIALHFVLAPRVAEAPS